MFIQKELVMGAFGCQESRVEAASGSVRRDFHHIQESSMGEATPRFVLEEHNVPADQWLSSDLLREVLSWSTECEYHWRIADSYDPGFYVWRGAGERTLRDSSDNYVHMVECEYICAVNGWRIACCSLVAESNRGYIVAVEPGPGCARPCFTWYGDGERYSDAYEALQGLVDGGSIVPASI